MAIQFFISAIIEIIQVSSWVISRVMMLLMFPMTVCIAVVWVVNMMIVVDSHEIVVEIVRHNGCGGRIDVFPRAASTVGVRGRLPTRTVIRHRIAVGVVHLVIVLWRSSM
jgi:hypothetical protein